MSVQACPECSYPVSDAAEHCPHCGFPLIQLQAKKIAPDKVVSPLVWISGTVAVCALLATGLGLFLIQPKQAVSQAVARPSATGPSEAELKAKALELEIERVKLEQAKLKQSQQTSSGSSKQVTTVVVQPPAIQVTDSELANLDCRSLWILRNTIYARHGRIFQTAEVRNYFNQQAWYQPHSGYHDGLLSQAEKQSAANILAIEKSSGCI